MDDDDNGRLGMWIAISVALLVTLGTVLTLVWRHADKGGRAAATQLASASKTTAPAVAAAGTVANVASAPNVTATPTTPLTTAAATTAAAATVTAAAATATSAANAAAAAATIAANSAASAAAAGVAAAAAATNPGAAAPGVTTPAVTTPGSPTSATGTRATADADAVDLPLTGDLLGKVYFDVAKADIAGASVGVVDKAASVIAASATRRVVLSGFHDLSGTPAKNAELAKDRAKAVREALQSKGVAADRIVLRKPAETGTGGAPEEARRVEIRLVD